VTGGAAAVSDGGGGMMMMMMTAARERELLSVVMEAKEELSAAQEAAAAAAAHAAHFKAIATKNEECLKDMQTAHEAFHAEAVAAAVRGPWARWGSSGGVGLRAC
jgi:hypothetical protein